MITLLISFLTAVQVLSGFFSGNLYPEKNEAQGKAEVLAEITYRNPAELPKISLSSDLEKPSSKPSASVKPKAKVKLKDTGDSKATNTDSAYTAESILKELNDYRNKNGAGRLLIDSKLQEYAQSRANYLKNSGKLDKHAGHQAFMADNGFEKLGFDAVAENQSYNYKGSAQGLVVSLYGKSSGHNRNQLNSEYTHVGIGVSGVFTNIVFGGKKK